jgi:hypothetical protein
MCLNCGCGEPADDQGKPENITIRDLRDAAAANGQTLRESAQHIQEAVAAYERRESFTGEGSTADGLAQPAGSDPAPAASKGTPGTES